MKVPNLSNVCLFSVIGILTSLCCVETRHLAKSDQGVETKHLAKSKQGAETIGVPAPCAPRTNNVDVPVGLFGQMEKQDEKAEIKKVIIKFKEANRIIRQMTRMMKNKARKKSTRLVHYLETWNGKDDLVVSTLLPAKQSSFLQVRKLRENVILRVLTIVRKLRNTSILSKNNRKWSRWMFKLERKIDDILCAVQHIVRQRPKGLVPFDTVIYLPKRLLLPKNRLKRFVVSYWQLKAIKSSMSKLIRSYKQHLRLL